LTAAEKGIAEMSILNAFSLESRVIVVTGATSGIGRAIAIACADAGATVAAIGRNRQKLDDLKPELDQYGHPCFCESFDVTDYEKIPDLISRIVSQCGKIGGFVHAAGTALTCPIRMMNAKAYEDIYAVNVIAGFEFVRVISSKRYLAEEASMLFIGSVAGIKGEPALLAYSSSKGAVLAGVRSMAVELGSRNIRVNALIPGLIMDTDMGRSIIGALPQDAAQRLEKQHLLGWGNVEAITPSVIYFLSRASLWVTGSSLTVDGGYTL